MLKLVLDDREINDRGVFTNSDVNEMVLTDTELLAVTAGKTIVRKVPSTSVTNTYVRQAGGMHGCCNRYS